MLLFVLPFPALPQLFGDQPVLEGLRLHTIGLCAWNIGDVQYQIGHQRSKRPARGQDSTLFDLALPDIKVLLPALVLIPHPELFLLELLVSPEVPDPPKRGIIGILQSSSAHGRNISFISYNLWRSRST